MRSSSGNVVPLFVSGSRVRAAPSIPTRSCSPTALVPKNLKVPGNSCHGEAKVRTARGLGQPRSRGTASVLHASAYKGAQTGRKRGPTANALAQISTAGAIFAPGWRNSQPANVVARPPISFPVIAPLTGTREAGHGPGGSKVDVAEPPRIVVESRASCASAERAEELLHDALGRRAGARPRVDGVDASPADRGARAPRRRRESSTNSASSSPTGLLSVPAGDCRGLARAVGVWASLVLEQELARSDRRWLRTRHCRSPREARRASRAPPRLPGDESQSTDVLWPAPAPSREAASGG